MKSMNCHPDIRCFLTQCSHQLADPRETRFASDARRVGVAMPIIYRLLPGRGRRHICHLTLTTYSWLRAAVSNRSILVPVYSRCSLSFPPRSDRFYPLRVSLPCTSMDPGLNLVKTRYSSPPVSCVSTAPTYVFSRVFLRGTRTNMSIN